VDREEKQREKNKGGEGGGGGAGEGRARDNLRSFRAVGKVEFRPKTDPCGRASFKGKGKSKSGLFSCGIRPHVRDLEGRTGTSEGGTKPFCAKGPEKIITEASGLRRLEGSARG